MVKASRDEFIANLPIQLLVQWFGCSAIQPNHFKSQDRMATPFFDDVVLDSRFHFIYGMPQRDASRTLPVIASSRQSGLAISLQVDC